MPARWIKLVLTVLLAFSPALILLPGSAALADNNRDDRDDRDDDRDDPDDDRDDRPPQAPPPPVPPKGPPGKNPSAKVRGRYVLKFAGYYRGGGEAKATGSGIKITGKVKDPKGNEFTVSSKDVEVTNDRFRGTGSLNSMEIQIDGRLDPKDDGNGKVLKRGRIILTFRVADGHSGRAAGDMKEPGQ